MPTIREYLVSLGAEVDNKSFSKFRQALSGTAKSVAAFGTAVTALMGMVAKTSIELDKTTQAYEEMAKKQKKSIDLVRAEETALKILGKTKKEVERDADLKQQYKDLKAIGEELRFVNVGEGEKSLRGLLQDFDKLRMVSTYAMNWINHEFLRKIRAPLEDVRRHLQQFTDRLKKNLPRLTDMVSTSLSNMFRIVLAGVNAVADLAGRFEKLPESVKLVGLAITAALGISKFGPVVLLIGGITTLLALLDDYQTWLRGGESALGDFWTAMQNGEAVEYMKGKLDELPGKITEINTKITEFMSGFFTKGQEAADKLIEGINGRDWSKDGSEFATFMGNLAGGIITFLNTNLVNGTGFFASVAEAAGKLVTGLSTALGTALSSFPWEATFTGLMTGADNLLTIVGAQLFGTQDENGDKQYQGLVKSFSDTAKSLVTGLLNAVNGTDAAKVSAELSKVVNHVFDLIGNALSTENITDAVSVATSLGTLAVTVAQKLFDLIGTSAATLDLEQLGTTVSTAINTLLGKMVEFMSGPDGISADLEKLIESGKNAAVSVAQGLFGFFSSAFGQIEFSKVRDLVSSVLTSIVGLISKFFEGDALGQVLSTIGDTLVLAGNIATGLVGAILDGFAQVDLSTVGPSIGGAMNQIFKKIGEFFTAEAKNSEGKSFTERFGDLGTTLIGIAQGLVDMIGAAFGPEGLQLENVTGAVSGLIGGVFGLISQVFSQENIAGAADVLASLATIGGDMAISLINGIGQMFGGGSAIPLDKVTGSVSTMIKTVFDKITEYAGKLLEKDADGKTFGERLGDSVKNLGTGLVKAIGSSVEGVGFADIKDSTVGMVKSLFELFKDVFSPENISAALGTATDLADTGLNIALELVGSIASGFGDLVLDDGKDGGIAGYVGSMIKSVLGKLSEFLGKLTTKDESGKTFGERFGVTFGNLAQNFVKAFTTPFLTLNLDDDVATPLADLVNKVFSLIGDVFSAENIRTTTGAVLDLVGAGKEVAKKVAQSIGTAFTSLNTTDIGTDIGSGISAFFGKIADWLGEQIADDGEGGKSLLGTIATSIGTVAKKIGELLSTAIGTVVDSGTLKTFGTNLAKFLGNAIDQFIKDVDNENIDLSKIGTDIGNAIGGAIKLAVDFLESFVTEAGNWLKNGGTEKLVDFGKKIIGAILAGIGNIYDAIMAQLFGESYTEVRDEQKKNAETRRKINEYMGEHPDATREEATLAVTKEEAEQEGRQTKVETSTANGYQYTYFEAMNEISGWLNTRRLRGSWSPEFLGNFSSEDQEILGKMYNSPDDMLKAKDVLAKRFGFSTYAELEEGSYINGEHAVIPQIQADNAQAQQAIGQTTQSLDDLDGKTATTNIVTNHTDTYDTGGVPQALGGRFSTATRGVFGEDGTEYIIPITKPARAKALILQMFREMGAGASSILSELGASGSSDMGGFGASWSSQPAAMFPQAGGSVKANSDNTVTVPTTINVYGSGDALMAGRAAARASQSNVLRAVRGVVGA